MVMAGGCRHPGRETRKRIANLESPARLGEVRGMDWWALGVALLLLALFGGGAYAIRRFAGALGMGGAGGAQHIHVVGARRLDLHTTLYLVEVEGRRLLVGSGREGARLVADLTAESHADPLAGFDADGSAGH